MNTQLDSIKSEARMLLYTDVHLTEFSPVVVQHPFTTSGFVGIKEDGSVRILEVSENEDDLHPKYRQFFLSHSCTAATLCQ